MNDEFILYGLAESGNCYKVALMLDLCGIEWSARSVDLFNREARSEFERNGNEFSEIPLLKHNEVALSQTGVILTYLSELTGKFSGRNAEERREVLRWLLFDNHKFTSFYQLTRQEHGLKRSSNTPVIEFVRQHAVAAMTTVEKRLDDRPFIIGEIPTIADISMAGFQFYEEETGIDLSKFPNIASWKQRIAELPGWRHPYSNQLDRGLDWTRGPHPVWPAH